MSNPYQSPSHIPSNDNTAPTNLVGPPAIALMVVSGIAVVAGVLALAMDVKLLQTGMVDQLEASNRIPLSNHTTVMIRFIWGVVHLFAASYVFYGAVKMKNMTDYEIAKSAAIVAMIPLLAPCCLLGIPFGYWAFTTLNNPNVKRAFKS